MIVDRVTRFLTSPQTVRDWRQVPPVPAAAFKSLTLAAAPAVEIFRSSGTTDATGEQRSVHHQPFPDLYRRVIDASFPRFCLPFSSGPLPILSLIPSREGLPAGWGGGLLPQEQNKFMPQLPIGAWRM